MTGDCVGQGPRKPDYRHSKPGRLGPNGWLKSLPIWTLLVTMTLIAGCANINAPAGGCEWVKPISLAELDLVPIGTRLVTEARVRPDDIGLVKTGQGALVRVTAFN